MKALCHLQTPKEIPELHARLELCMLHRHRFHERRWYVEEAQFSLNNMLLTEKKGEYSLICSELAVSELSL